jgi:hypothetical protein
MAAQVRTHIFFTTRFSGGETLTGMGTGPPSAGQRVPAAVFVTTVALLVGAMLWRGHGADAAPIPLVGAASRCLEAVGAPGVKLAGFDAPDLPPPLRAPTVLTPAWAQLHVAWTPRLPTPPLGWRPLGDVVDPSLVCVVFEPEDGQRAVVVIGSGPPEGLLGASATHLLNPWKRYEWSGQGVSATAYRRGPWTFALATTGPKEALGRWVPPPTEAAADGRPPPVLPALMGRGVEDTRPGSVVPTQSAPATDP